jgi:hypothetical protein
MARNNFSPVQQFRGTTAQHETYTGLPGELTVDTDKNVVVVHDGVTEGGHPTVPDKFLFKSTGGILTFNAGTEAPLQGDSITVEIDLAALEAVLGGTLTAFADLPVYFTGVDEVIHTVLADDWGNVVCAYLEADGTQVSALKITLQAETGGNEIVLTNSPQSLGALKGKAVKLKVTGITDQTWVAARVRFTA